MKNENQKFCSECGTIINIKAEICPNCGVRQLLISQKIDFETDNKWLITLLLCWFLGVFGIHRFYNGHITVGILQILTLGGCGVWVLIDLILIIVGSFKDSKGNYIKNKS